jgi:membrane fusion protein, multidrug efflux system
MTRGKGLIWALALALAVGAGAWTYQRLVADAAAPAGAVSGAAGGAGSGTADARAAPPILDFAETDLATVAPGRFGRTIPLTGTLRPVNQTLVRAKVAGELREVLVREGMPVRRGQPVARIDASELELRVRERDAQLKSLAAQVEQANRTLENTRALHERNFVSQSALDIARSNWEVAVANREAAAAQLALARRSQADATIAAPIDGTVAERFAQPGEKVAVDARILSIVDLSRMEIEAPVPAAEVGSVRVGQAVELAVEGVAAPQLGRVVRIAPTTQPGTRSVPVYIALDNRDPAIRAGLFAQGRLEVGSRDDVLAVPSSAIRDANGRTFVYAIVDGRLVERDVVVGQRSDTAPNAAGGIGAVEIRDGLAPGDRIVATNLGILRAGSGVRVVSPAAAQAKH